MTDKKFYQKAVILDTNILSNTSKKERALKYRPVLEYLQENESERIVLDSTYFEFAGFAGNKKSHDFFKKYAENYFARLPITPEDVGIAVELSSLYKHLDSSINTKQISFCDCLHAAQLIKYTGRVYIVTTDIYDYPISIFDVKRVDVLDDGKKATLVGYITYNEKKYLSAKEKFEKSTG